MCFPKKRHSCVARMTNVEIFWRGVLLSGTVLGEFCPIGGCNRLIRDGRKRWFSGRKECENSTPLPDRQSGLISAFFWMVSSVSGRGLGRGMSMFLLLGSSEIVAYRPVCGDMTRPSEKRPLDGVCCEAPDCEDWNPR